MVYTYIYNKLHMWCIYVWHKKWVSWLLKLTTDCCTLNRSKRIYIFENLFYMRELTRSIPTYKNCLIYLPTYTHTHICCLVIINKIYLCTYIYIYERIRTHLPPVNRRFIFNCETPSHTFTIQQQYIFKYSTSANAK